MQRSLFSPEVAQSLRYQQFQQTELGRLRSVLPIKELSECLKKRQEKRGAPARFDNVGKIALQFLKAYLNLSDEKLLARLNTDWALQMFCGIDLGPNEMIRDKDLLWKIRAEVAGQLDVERMQKILIDAWKLDMHQTNIGLCDATCYESYIKYPTDQKLLFDCCIWLNKEIKNLAKSLSLRRPRNKFKDQKRKQLSFAKSKRKSYKKKRSRTRQLLYLLNKQLNQLEELLAYHYGQACSDPFLIDDFFIQRFQIIGKIYEQQRFMYEHKVNSVPDRIVSLYKPYLRPIVRGKELKRVEFGAKFHTWQVDGLNFIEHFSFSNFHEGIRLKNGIAFHQKNFGKLNMIGADNIYPTNENRKLVSRFNIGTCFKPKGRRKADPLIQKQEDKVRQAIGLARSTILEGSYGNDKNHYGLRKIKARNELTEISWIFFGMMTANAVKMAKRFAKAPPAQQRA